MFVIQKMIRQNAVSKLPVKIWVKKTMNGRDAMNVLIDIKRRQRETAAS